MEIHKEKVHLLSITPYRSADLIVNFLSSTFGRLAALIYGGKKIGKKTSFPYQQGDYIEIEFQIQERNEFVKLYSVHSIKLLDIDKLPYDRFLSHCYFLEIVKLMAMPGHPEPDLAELVDFYLSQPWSQSNKYQTIITILWRLITSLGYAINYNDCARCGKPTMQPSSNEMRFRKQIYFLNLESGGLICSDCESKKQSPEFNSSMIKVLWMLNRNEVVDFIASPIPSDVLRPLISTLNQHLTINLGTRPKSTELFINSL